HQERGMACQVPDVHHGTLPSGLPRPYVRGVAFKDLEALRPSIVPPGRHGGARLRAALPAAPRKIRAQTHRPMVARRDGVLKVAIHPQAGGPRADGMNVTGRGWSCITWRMTTHVTPDASQELLALDPAGEDALDAYSRAVIGVVDQVGPAVVSVLVGR